MTLARCLATALATIAALGGVAPGELVVVRFGRSGAFYELQPPANDCERRP